MEKAPATRRKCGMKLWRKAVDGGCQPAAPETKTKMK
jgi:hypothetical protein